MSNYNQPRREVTDETVKILSGQTISNAFNCQGKSIVGIPMPVAFTGTKFTLLSSFTSDGTFQPVYDIFGNQVEITAGAGTNIECNGFLGNKFYKLVSDASEGADRTIQIILVGF